MKRRILIAMLLFASAALAQSDPWAALRVFEGKWEGTVTGKPGKQVSHREYHFEYNDKFLSQRDDSVYQPQSSSDRSGNRGDFGVFSYDVIHRGAYETMAEHFALLVDGHQGSKVESTKKLLALVQETSGLGETPWADRDIGVQVSSTIMCFPSDWWSALGHASFCRCPPAISMLSGAHSDLTGVLIPACNSVQNSTAVGDFPASSRAAPEFR